MSNYRARHARRGRATTAATAATVTVSAAGAVLAADVSVAAAHDRSFPTMLSELRGCESGGNYSTNTGNGYSGAYQFDQGTWESVGGTGRPHQNEPEVQDEMATRLYERRGWSPWPSCSRSEGLHETTVERPWAGTDPDGAVDGAAGRYGGIDVRGWAFDRDTSPEAIGVNAHVDGARESTYLRAAQSRPDVGEAHGVGDDHGFSGRVPAGPGGHSVCFYAINGGGGEDTFLGCRDVVVPHAPIGAVDSVQVVPGGVRVTGWTLDQDTPDTPTDAHLYVDGGGPTVVRADQPRPDVARRYGGSEARGFDVVVPSGEQVCGFAIETDGTNRGSDLGCRTPSV